MKYVMETDWRDIITRLVRTKTYLDEVVKRSSQAESQVNMTGSKQEMSGIRNQKMAEK